MRRITSAFSRSSQVIMPRTPQDSNVRAPQDTMTRALPLAAPTNMLPVQVIERQVIAPDVVSIQIVLPGTSQAPAPYLSGQFVTLALPTPRETLYRSYSLCGDGDPSRPWELTIKRMQMGAVSNYFYQSVQQGTLLYASLPRGTFTLPGRLTPEMAFVFVATGSGITPIMGMLRAIRRLPAQERPLVQLHYASRTPDDIIYGDELNEMDPDRIWLRQLHYVSSEGYRMTVDDILDYAGPAAVRAHWYMCGADNFKRELQTELEAMGVSVRQIHTEVFGSQHGPAYRVGQSVASTEPTDLFIADTGDALNVEPGETLLAALERNGYHPEFSCRAGICGSCKLRDARRRGRSAGRNPLASREGQRLCAQLYCPSAGAGDACLWGARSGGDGAPQGDWRQRWALAHIGHRRAGGGAGWDERPGNWIVVIDEPSAG